MLRLQTVSKQHPEQLSSGLSLIHIWDLGELNRMTPEEKKTWTDYYAKRTKSLVDGMKSVSYTHLDVYKRQIIIGMKSAA